jgi:hypothetical protein
VVMDADFGLLVVNIRTLARSSALFDRDARRILARELSVAALRLHPKGGRQIVRSERHDHDGAPLFRLVMG